MKYLILVFAILTSAMAQEIQSLPSPVNNALPSAQAEEPKEKAIEQLFSTMGEAGFPEALIAAQEAKIHPQVLLEARFLHLIDTQNYAGLAAMAPELISKSDNFDPDNSEIFSVKEDWLAIVHYTQALAALQNGDKAGFKSHITEAFWLSPRQGQAFAPHIDELRLAEAMKSITLDPAQPLTFQGNGKPASLGALMNERKATILHFWSPTSREVQLNLPDFILTTQSCEQQNINVLSILVGQYPNILEDAESIRKEDAAEAESIWLVESNKKSLANFLRVRDIPRMVIVSPDGKILFNGDPSDNKFWATIQKIAPAFTRPNNNKENPQQD